LQSKEGDRGSKRGADDSDPVRTPWELARDQHMSNQVENYNVRKTKTKLSFCTVLSRLDIFLCCMKMLNSVAGFF